MGRKDKYLQKIYELFTQEEADSLTMVDIAEKIGITKMTLYNNFKDKEEIIESIILYRSQKFMQFMESGKTKNNNAIESLISVIRFQRENPITVSNLYKVYAKNFPAQFKEHEKRFKERLKMFITQNIQQGQEEGLYRDNVDADEISAYIIQSADNMIGKTIKGGTDINLGTLHQSIVEYHLRGIVNENGLKYLSQKHK